MCFVGELLDENIATFRCYGNISQAKYYVPTPPQELCTKIIQLDWFAKFVYGGTPRTSSPTKKQKGATNAPFFCIYPLL